MAWQPNFTNPDPARKPNAIDKAKNGFGRDTSDRGFNPTPNELYYGGRVEAADEDINRARQRGDAAAGRTAYQTDFTQSNESRGDQVGALGLLRNAAEGNAPSRAEIAGNAAMDRSLQNTLAVAGSARGGAANQAAATRGAQVGMAGQRAQMTQGIQAERAAEMAQARQGYAGAATAQRQTDLGAAGIQQQSELYQRGLNQGQEQFYEGQAQRTREDELNANLQRQQMADTRGANWRQQTNAESQQDYSKNKDIVSTVLGAAGSIFSDVAAKVMAPMGGLGALGLGGTPAGASPTVGGAQGMASGSPLGELKAHSNVATQFQRNAGSGPSMMSDYSAKVPGPNIVSDPRAKKEAFLEGVNYANDFHEGKPQHPMAFGAEEKKSEPKKEEAKASKPEKSGFEMAVVPENGARMAAPLMGAGPAIGQLAQATKNSPEKVDNAASSVWTAALGPVAGTFMQPRIDKALASSRIPSDERAKKVLSKEAPFAESNRSLRAQPYAYKDEFRPPEQAPGEVNVGPMAQTMAEDPVARTAIKEEPGSDLLTIDRDKGLKVVMGGLASLQNQVDALASARSTKRKR
jgi:hypothetical protein